MEKCRTDMPGVYWRVEFLTNGGQGSKGDALDAQPIVGSVEILNGDLYGFATNRH